MTWILNGDLAHPIEDNAPFRGADGTGYPGNWDKSAVPGMVKVVETDKPSPLTDIVTGSTIVNVGGVPTRVWQSTPIPINDRKAAIKAEARRRILAVFPDWKQANMTARGVELVKLRALNGLWTTGELAEADALQAAWDWIKAVRAASDALEVSLPVDYAADANWPAKPGVTV